MLKILLIVTVSQNADSHETMKHATEILTDEFKRNLICSS